MILEFGSYKLDVDVERTRAYYETARPISEGCSCCGCRNYVNAIDFLPKEVQLFFSQLGIDMRKSPDVHIHCAYTDNTMLYGGWYHICATLIRGESAFIQTSPTSSYFDESKTFSVTSDFKVSFEKNCSLLDDKFPRPVIQLEIHAYIPWVLAEEHGYGMDAKPTK